MIIWLPQEGQAAYDGYAAPAGAAASPFPPGAFRPRQVVWAKVRSCTTMTPKLLRITLQHHASWCRAWPAARSTLLGLRGQQAGAVRFRQTGSALCLARWRATTGGRPGWCGGARCRGRSARPRGRPRSCGTTSPSCSSPARASPARWTRAWTPPTARCPPACAPSRPRVGNSIVAFQLPVYSVKAPPLHLGTNPCHLTTFSSLANEQPVLFRSSGGKGQGCQ